MIAIERAVYGNALDATLKCDLRLSVKTERRGTFARPNSRTPRTSPLIHRRVERLAGSLHSWIIINQRLTRVDLRGSYWTRGGHKQKEKHGAFCNDLEMLIYLWTVARNYCGSLCKSEAFTRNNTFQMVASLSGSALKLLFLNLRFSRRQTLGIAVFARNMMDYRRCTEGNLMKFSS